MDAGGILGLVSIANDVAAIITGFFEEPREHVCAVLRIRDARLCGPAIDIQDVVARGGAPVDIAGGSVGPAFDPSEQPFRTRSIALDPVLATLDEIRLRSSACRNANLDQILSAREHERVRASGIEIARETLVGLARDSRHGQIPADAEGPIAGARVVRQLQSQLEAGPPGRGGEGDTQ